MYLIILILITEFQCAAVESVASALAAKALST